jgi:hypothetical protein
MKRTLLGALAAGVLMIGGIAAASQNAHAAGETKYRVTIANATYHQPIAPSLAITHRKSFSLFQINHPASTGLATMAETGNPGVLFDEVDGAPGVRSAMTTAPIPFNPNDGDRYISFDITTSGNAKYFTAAGMLAGTNDAFYAVRGIRLPVNGKIVVHANAYDAGSEANNELAGDVPAIGNGDDEGVNFGDGEGFIHIHRGIHGVEGGDLPPAIWDWRNPVVKITIERLTGRND